ncbi:MAG: hypothetical protein M3Y65_19890 [Pseudomonadota bacterium]|nr:hypothetical protein [Pseudomonadota bacterium]
MPLKFAAILLLAPALAHAYDGMDYTTAYRCQADAINQDLVETCSARFPELTQSAADAIAHWRSRNTIKANAAHDLCIAEHQEPSETATQFRQQMDGLRFDLKTDFQLRTEDEGPSACIAALEQLDLGDADMDFE